MFGGDGNIHCFFFFFWNIHSSDTVYGFLAGYTHGETYQNGQFKHMQFIVLNCISIKDAKNKTKQKLTD